MKSKQPAPPRKSSRAAFKRGVTKKAGESEESSGLMGFAKISREGGRLIELVSTSKKELVFGAGKHPQLRMRPASAHRDEADEIPEKRRIDLNEFKGKLSQYRAIIMFGAMLEVRSGRHFVIVDRHPRYRADVVDDFAQDLRSQTRVRANAATRKNAKMAATSSQQILELLKESARESKIYHDTTMDCLERLLEQGARAVDDRKLRERIRLREGADIEVNRRRGPPSEDDLDRTEVD